ncbi:MAG: tRNA (adenosine(37)-N6)-threonylcarbamoyltransferase complex dimerization subunit type 1 TsaB [Oscillospiraceae bacterium]|nr:tRNA (adenosine(37)-N6)-threonylcarbamoyltransferase complex dimerization subunit type 1 TsaB [Oscillospiraceae bacterium]
MLILAIESSAKPVSCAVYSGGALLGQYFQNNGLTHSRTLLVMVESLLKNLDIATQDLDLVAVARGPGSFTGVRIGVSAAKGLAWGLDKPVAGVSTLEAMAYQIPHPGAIICPVMDARRGQVYNALFEWKDGNLVRLCEDRAISLTELADDLKRFTSPFILLGDGAGISYESLKNTGVPVSLAPELLRYQTAYGIALAAVNSIPIPEIALEPSYLRPSQAERERGG